MTTAAVTKERKHQLLLQARQERISWVQASSFPHQPSPHCNDTLFNSSSNTPPGLNSILPILASLYGEPEPFQQEEEKDGQVMNEALKARIQKQVDRIHREDGSVRNTKHENSMSPPPGMEDPQVHSVYPDLIQTLCRPESAELVQVMRHYDRALVEFIDNAESTTKQHKKMEEVARSIHTSLKSLHSKAASHSLLTSKHASSSMNEALDVFMYSKWKGTLSTLLETEDFKQQEKKWNDRISFLQFVQPSHLDLTLVGDIHDQNDWRNILSQPMEILKALDRFYAPGQMLQCITQVYRTSIQILSNRTTEENEQEKKPPSADDILPTLVICTIGAQPNRILANLRFFGMFCDRGTNEG